jgi:hypothetical protein
MTILRMVLPRGYVLVVIPLIGFDRDRPTEFLDLIRYPILVIS